MGAGDSKDQPSDDLGHLALGRELAATIRRSLAEHGTHLDPNFVVAMSDAVEELEAAVVAGDLDAIEALVKEIAELNFASGG